MTEERKEYDFIIVGSGIGGLVAGVILGMEGHSVLVLEKNHQIGGSLQVFSRDKRIFDTGVHYIGSLDEGENLYQIFKYIGIMDDLKMQRLDQDAYDVICFPDGKRYVHGHGYDGFKKGLLKDFPEEEAAIDAFCDKVEEVCGCFPLYNLEVDAPTNYLRYPEVLSLGAWEFVESITNNKRLQSVLLGTGPLYAGDKGITPFYVVALITKSYLMGSYRMINGGSQIAKLLTKRIRSLGGDVLKHKEVVSATYDDRNIRSVKTKSGDEFFGKTFISGIHPKRTIDIFGQEQFRAAYRHRIEKVPNTISSFMVYLSFHEDMFPFMNYNLYVYNKEEVWETVDYSEKNWPEFMFLSTPPSKDQGEFADCLNIMTYMSYDEVKEWGDTFNTVAESSDRGEAYQEFKRRKEEAVIKELEKTFPDIRKCIKNIYSSTPLTYKDYIGTDDGSLYGILKDVNNITYSKINARTRIPNLYQTGQNLVFHGILGATIGSIVTCFQFVDNQKLVDSIKKA